jgi:hypothetical protein
MKRTVRRDDGKQALELIEEATHLLRTAPAATLAFYYLGAIPFVLALLFFWGEMSRSPFASRHLASATLRLAVFYLWMRFWQVIFLQHLRASLSGSASPSLTIKRSARILITQTALQPLGLFLLPVALVLTLPFPWAFAFFQNAAVLCHGESAELGLLIKQSCRQAVLWPRQNHLALVLLLGFAFAIFLNCGMVCFLLPGLVKTLFGVENFFTRNPVSLLNSTFFAAILILTYLCVDPLVKAVYALRCFYGDSLESGEDLKAELRQISLSIRPIVASLLLGFLSFDTASASSGWQERCPEPLGFHLQASDEVTPFFDSLNSVTFSELLKRESITILQTAAPNDGQTAPVLGATEAVPEDYSALDQAIQQVVQKNKYAWRLPRDAVEEAANTKQGILERFLERVGKLFRQWLSEFWRWIGNWLRKLFSRQASFQTGGSGYGWILAQEVLLYGLVSAAVIGLGVLVYRILRQRKGRFDPIPTQPVQPLPDLTDENIAADQLPEDGWTSLARELLARGELRLALRAFYFASLAHLAQRNLVSLAKFKSNRDYERELQRRAHSLPDLLICFGENVEAIDRTWYGLHELSSEAVSKFVANLEQMRTLPNSSAVPVT